MNRRDFIWISPVVIAITLPAHAMTSVVIPVEPPIELPVEPPIEPPELPEPPIEPPEPPIEPEPEPICDLPEVVCDDKNKISFCHVPPQGNMRTINVSCDEQTLCDHQGHGDDVTDGGCD